MDSLARLSDAEQLSLLERDSELLSHLLSDLTKSSAELHEKIQIILKNTPKDLEEAHPFLKLKYLLLINYCSNISFFLLKKSKSENLENSEIISQILQIRNYFEKIKILEKKLKQKILNYLKKSEKISENSEISENSALFSENSENDEKFEFFDEIPEKIPENSKKIEKSKKLLEKNKISAEILQKFSDFPEEIRDENFENSENSENFRKIKISKKNLQKNSNFGEIFEDLEDFGEILENAKIEINEKIRKSEKIEEFSENDEILEEISEKSEKISEKTEKFEKIPKKSKNVEIYLENSENSEEISGRKITKNIEKNKFMTKNRGAKKTGRIQLKNKFSKEEKKWVKKRRDGAGNYSGESAISENARGMAL